MPDYLCDIDASLAGEPCILRVFDYDYGTPADLSGPPEECDPGDPPEAAWQILTPDGKPWPSELTLAQEEALFERVMQHMNRLWCEAPSTEH
jgi:hypothetical protein